MRFCCYGKVFTFQFSSALSCASAMKLHEVTSAGDVTSSHGFLHELFKTSKRPFVAIRDTIMESSWALTQATREVEDILEWNVKKVKQRTSPFYWSTSLLRRCFVVS